MNWEFGARRVRSFGSGGPAIWMVADFDLAERVANQCPEGEATIVALEGVDWDRELTPWPSRSIARGRPDFGAGADDLLGEWASKMLSEVEAALRPTARWIVGYSLAGLFAVYAALATPWFSRVASVSGSMWYPGFADWAIRRLEEGVGSKRAECPEAREAGFAPGVAARIPGCARQQADGRGSDRAEARAGDGSDAQAVPAEGCARPAISLERAYFSVGDRERFGRNPAFRTVEDDARRIAAALQARGVSAKFETRPGGHFCDPAGRIARAIQWLLAAREAASAEESRREGRFL